MSGRIEPRKVVGYTIVAFLVGLLVVQYVLALGPAAEHDRASACAALDPQPFNPSLGKLPAKAIDFTAKNARGEAVPLSAYLGKVVFLNFWNSTCQPCIEEMPAMEELQRKLGPEGLVVLALASEEGFKPVDEFFGHREPAMTVLLDPIDDQQAVGEIARRWGTQKWPETYLIDRKGVVRHYIVNKRDWASGNAMACVRSLLDE